MKANDLLRHLDDAAKQIRSGRLDDEVMTLIERAFERSIESQFSEVDLEKIRAAAQRNAELLDAMRRGIASARATIVGAGDSPAFNTYTDTGAQSQLRGSRRFVERRS